MPDKDEFSQSRLQMNARIDVCMGGKVAEEVIFGRDAVTSGARSDLQQATSLARHMVTECGMSDELGMPLAQPCCAASCSLTCCQGWHYVDMRCGLLPTGLSRAHEHA